MPDQLAPVLNATSAQARGRRSCRRDLLLGLAAMAIASALVLPQLFNDHGNVTVFLRVGRYAASRPYVERDFHHPVLTQDYGHDGQQFYVVASTFPNPSKAVNYVDRIRYRFRRILFPLLVSPFRGGPALVWAMFAVNLLAIGAAAIALSRLAMRLGGSPWVGLVAGISPALIESLQGSLGDGLAFALAIWAVVMWRRSIVTAVVLLTLAALSRETTLVVAAACFVVGDGRQRRWLVIPPAVYLGWVVATSLFLPTPPHTGSESVFRDASDQLALPFRAFFQLGAAAPAFAFGAALFAASIFAAWQLRHRLPEVSLWLLFDAGLLAISGVPVLDRPLNLARVVPMALPGLALAVVDRLQDARRAPSQRRHAVA
jgi:hypothetical protein